MLQVRFSGGPVISGELGQKGEEHRVEGIRIVLVGVVTRVGDDVVLKRRKTLLQNGRAVAGDVAGLVVISVGPQDRQVGGQGREAGGGHGCGDCVPDA